jgi:hypothetical protein
LLHWKQNADQKVTRPSDRTIRVPYSYAPSAPPP